MLSPNESDLLLVQYFMDEIVTGIYSIAAALSAILMILPQSIGVALFPHIAKVEHLDGLDGTDKTMTSFRLTMLLTVSAALVSIVAAPWLIEWVYGAAYADATWPYIILAVSVCAGGGAFVLDG